jgi:DNA mismatch repair protein MutS
MSLIAQYYKYCDEYKTMYGEKTVVLIQVGSFFEVYGERSGDTYIKSPLSKISQLCCLNIARKNEKNVMIGFRDYQLDKYIEILINAGWTVPVFVQDAQCSNTTRSLLKIYSPGTTFLVNDQKISNNICCFWIEKKNSTLINLNEKLICGISCIDIYTGYSVINEYIINPYTGTQTDYNELERLYNVYDPSEIIIVYKNVSEEMIKNIIQYLNIDCCIRLKNSEDKDVVNCEKQTYQTEILSKIFNSISCIDSFEFAKQSFCMIINSILLQNSQIINKIKEPEIYTMEGSVLLGNHSLKQLNIISTTSNNKLASISDFYMNSCKTSMGKREIKKIITNPIYDVKKLNEMYNQIEEMKKTEYDTTRDILTNVCDLEKFVRKLIIKKVTPLDIVSELYKSFNFVYKINLPFKKELITKINSYIEKTLNIKLVSNIIDGDTFNKSVCENIDSLNDQKQEYYEQMNSIIDYLNSLFSDKEKKTKKCIDIHETDRDGISLVLTDRRSKLLQTYLKTKKSSSVTLKTKNYNSFILNINTIKFTQSQSSKKKIENIEINKITREIIKLQNKIIDYAKIAFNKFINNLLDFNSDIKYLIEFVKNTDVVCCKTYLAVKHNYVKPIIRESDNSFADIKEIRHLIIEQLDQNEVYVANDIAFDEKQNGILLFGTNAVGKSSLIKSIGIAVLLAQCGIYVPCKEMIYSPYHSIFTRIVSNDNIFKGLSTFAVEMTEFNTILNNSNKNSLVLGDELCSGTETTSAISIFSSGVKLLSDRNVNFIFATHFHEITKISLITSIENLAFKHLKVFYNGEKDVLVYDRKLADGSGESIYGLEVCKSLHMPQDFITLAYDIRNELIPQNNDILMLGNSQYNSKKIRGNCEICNKSYGTDVHHLQYQNQADENGFIGSFHKNSLGNLINVCKPCHDKVHRENLQFKKQKTSDGFILRNLVN